MLKDELQYFDRILSEDSVNAEDVVSKLRAVRMVYTTLYNVHHAMKNFSLDDMATPKDFREMTRELRRDLEFANHFRNNGVGHLPDLLLEKAVQWHPLIFHINGKNNETIQLMLAQISTIESCVNSYVDRSGNQKNFKTEIDLNFPPDSAMFYDRLEKMVRGSITWISEAMTLIKSQISFSDSEDILHLSVVAGKTDFKLK